MDYIKIKKRNYDLEKMKEIFNGYQKLVEKGIFPTGYDCYLTGIKFDKNNTYINFADIYRPATYQITLKDIVLEKFDFAISYSTEYIFSMGVSCDENNKKMTFYITGNKANLECEFQSAEIKQIDDDNYRLRDFIQKTVENLKEFANKVKK